MKKNKLVLGLSVGVSLLFVMFLVHTAIDLGRVDFTLANSPNVEKVTDKIESKMLITSEDLGPSWVQDSFDDSAWKKSQIPKDWVLTEPGYKEGSFVYYRIRLPKDAIKKFSHLKNESVINLYYVSFSKADYYSNGTFIGTNKPANYNEAVLDVPIIENQDNLIAIKGYIKAGDIGLTHRGDVFAGKKAELNELHRKSYKGVTVFSLLFLMSKGSIFLILTLIFLVVRTEKYFEYSLLFSMFVFIEDIIIGDYISQYLNFNRQVVLYDFADIGYNTFLFLFLSSVIGWRISKKTIFSVVGILIVVSSLVSVDLLLFSKLFTVDGYLKYWNCVLMATILIFVPKLFSRNKILSVTLGFAVLLIGWSTFFTSTMANNFKAFANLIIFVTVAYQTFLLFRRQQNQLTEQEKDVAIGKTAAILAHDVRKPLDQMNLILNRLVEGDVDQEFLKIAKQDVQYSLNSVNNQISDIMNFNRTAEVQLQPISLYEVLSSSLKQVMTVSSNVQISLEYDFKADFKIMGEESRLSSAMTNVLSNCVEAIRDIGKMNSGKIYLNTSVEKDEVLLRVGNNGPLIPTNVLPNIFKPLFTSGKSSGTGLGLASVAKIMKDHQGDIAVRNVDGGVEYVLRFKASKEKEQIKFEEFKSISSEYTYKEVTKTISPRTVRVFLLDDDKYIFEYIKDLSRKANFEVELNYFNTIEDAKEALKKKRFDLHMVDNDLGDSISGQQFINEELLKFKTVVALHTGRTDLNVDMSKVRFVRKPISLEDYNRLLVEADKSRLKILLIEDSKLVGVGWKVFHGNANIHVCMSPEEGISYFRKNLENIDICLVDHHFDNSQMKGDEVIRELNSLNPKVKILSITSSYGESLGVHTIGKGDYEVRTIL